MLTMLVGFKIWQFILLGAIPAVFALLAILSYLYARQYPVLADAFILTSIPVFAVCFFFAVRKAYLLAKARRVAAAIVGMALYFGSMGAAAYGLVLVALGAK